MPDHPRTVRSYFDAFAPAPPWGELVSWPPDVFALTNLVLDHTEGYRFVVPPDLRRRGVEPTVIAPTRPPGVDRDVEAPGGFEPPEVSVGSELTNAC